MPNKRSKEENNEGGKQPLNISETPIVNNKTTLIFGCVTAVILYYFYTREYFNTHIHSQHQHGHSQNAHEYQQQSQYGHNQQMQHSHLDRSSSIPFVDALYDSWVRGKPAQQFIKTQQDFLILLCFAVSVIASLIFLLVRAIIKQANLNLHGPENARQCAEGISAEEFQEQSRYYTRQEVRKLQRSMPYREMKAEKGDQVSKWNWQARVQRPIHL